MKAVCNHFILCQMRPFIILPRKFRINDPGTDFMLFYISGFTPDFTSRKSSCITVNYDFSVNSVIIFISFSSWYTKRNTANQPGRTRFLHVKYLLRNLLPLFIKKELTFFSRRNTYRKIHIFAAHCTALRQWITCCYFYHHLLLFTAIRQHHTFLHYLHQ